MKKMFKPDLTKKLHKESIVEERVKEPMTERKYRYTDSIKKERKRTKKVNRGRRK